MKAIKKITLTGRRTHTHTRVHADDPCGQQQQILYFKYLRRKTNISLTEGLIRCSLLLTAPISYRDTHRTVIPSLQRTIHSIPWSSFPGDLTLTTTSILPYSNLETFCPQKEIAPPVMWLFKDLSPHRMSCINPHSYGILKPSLPIFLRCNLGVFYLLNNARILIRCRNRLKHRSTSTEEQKLYSELRPDVLFISVSWRTPAAHGSRTQIRAGTYIHC